MANISRKEYLNQLNVLRDQKIIKVITGIRRCGKSTLLQLFREKLVKDGVKKRQIQSYNYEDPEQNAILEWRKIYEKISVKLVAGEMNYIFLDEIQAVPEFEKMVDGLFIKENIDLYITGSNAFLLSGELATLLTGRYVSIHLLPFSFAEYREMFASETSETNEDRLFERYLSESSFPESIALSKVSGRAAENYLGDLYDTIVNKDITAHHEIRNRQDFARVVRFVMDNIGSPVSARRISATLNLQSSENVAHTTIIRYLDHLAKSYVIYPVSRYDIKGKKLLTTNDKYYVVDLGLRNIMLGSSQKSDLGHRLENVVYLELLRRNEGEIWVGKKDDSEVDFVVQKPGGGRIYYQVAYQVNDRPETLERELAPFWRLRDNYPKYLITTDLVREEFEGINKVNVVDWLLNRQS